jgi:hypothetical protein
MGGRSVALALSRGDRWASRFWLAALEAMRPFLDRAPARERPSVDLTNLGEAFGATGSATSTPP